MSIEQTKGIDFISTSPSGKIILTISDHLPWDTENKHLLELQNKLNSHLAFIESGEIYSKYPDAKGKEFIIQIMLKYHPVEDGILFLERCREQILAAGYDFIWKFLDN